MRIVPAPGRLARDPETRRLVDEVDGLTIDPTNLYWARLLQDGDVVEARETGPAAKSAPALAAPAEESDA